jgi:predicted permease
LLFRRDPLERDLKEETESYLEMLVGEKIETGMSPESARRSAQIEMGGIEQVKEQVREVRMGAGIDSLIQDIRSGIRLLVRRPGFALTVVFTLALGISATTAVFSVVESVLLRPLPYPEADRLVVPRNQSSKVANPYNITYPDYLMWKRAGVFESIATFASFSADLTNDGSEPSRVRVMEVGEGYFPTVRVTALQGRTFQVSDHAPGSQRAVLLAEQFWHSRYGADPDVLGRTIRIADVPHTVVGVVPGDAAAPRIVDVWTPMQPDLTREEFNDWDNGAYAAIARLKEGETIRATNTKLAMLANRVAEEHPGLRKGVTSLVLPLNSFNAGSSLIRALWILFGPAFSVLLIGCVNIANLLLSLGACRMREVAVRSALGAGRCRLVGQQLAEGFMLAVGGGAVGMLLSLWLVDSLIALAPPGIPRLQDVRPNGTVLIFGLALMTVSALIFSLAPALRSTAAAPAVALNEGNARTTAGRRERRSRHAIIALELALSLTLLGGAGYALQSLHNLSRTDPGFDHSRLLQVSVTLPQTRYQSGEPVINFYQSLLAQISALPGVDSATLRSAMPIGGGGFYLTRAYLREGYPEPPEGVEINGPWTVVGQDHFRTMGISLLRGRDFQVHDDQNTVPVMIVNQRFAEMMFGNEEPLGKRVRSWRDENVHREIVGVVGNERYFGVGDSIRPCAYIPHRQNRWRSMHVVIRTAKNPQGMIRAVRQVLGRLDPNLVPADISTVDEIFASNLAGPRFLSTLLFTYAIIALLLSATGIFGVLSYLVSLRTREIGLRKAVGARWSDITRMIIRDSCAALSIGMLAGLAGVLGLGWILQSLLFEVSLIEPSVILGVGSILAGTSLLAILVPACLAAGVDPVRALNIGQ